MAQRTGLLLGCLPPVESVVKGPDRSASGKAVPHTRTCSDAGQGADQNRSDATEREQRPAVDVVLHLTVWREHNPAGRRGMVDKAGSALSRAKPLPPVPRETTTPQATTDPLPDLHAATGKHKK